jgi:hypothetical protein
MVSLKDLGGMDPEKALKTGEKWGDTLGKAIFGVADVLRDGKNMKAAANSKRLNENASIAAKNAVIRAKNEAKIKQQQEAAIMNMSHSEREAYKKIMKEQRISSTVKKANEDEAISVGHILVIIVSIVAVLGAALFAAMALGVIHR